MNEEWRPVVGYEGLYEVSNLGRVKSLARWVSMRNGGTKLVGERILKPTPDTNGYLGLKLSRGGRGNQKSVRVHRLVARAFLGECPPGMEVCHHRPDKFDNSIGNIRYGTHRENTDERETRRWDRGEKSHFAKLTAEQVKEIQALKGVMIHREIAKIYGISRQHVSLIIRKKTWEHVNVPASEIQSAKSKRSRISSSL